MRRQKPARSNQAPLGRPRRKESAWAKNEPGSRRPPAYPPPFWRFGIGPRVDPFADSVERNGRNVNVGALQKPLIGEIAMDVRAPRGGRSARRVHRRIAAVSTASVTRALSASAEP